MIGARERQAHRYKGTKMTLNSEVITPRQIAELFEPTQGAKTLVSKLPEILPFPVSMRTKVQTLCVARTIADLEDSDELNALHVAKAALKYTRPLLASIEERRMLPISPEQVLDKARIRTP